MIIAIVLIAIIASFAIPKLTSINEKTNLSVLKSQLALIQNAIVNQKNKNILLSTEEIDILDEVPQNASGEKLFSKVIDFSIISTNTTKKESGMWAKISNNSYTFYLSQKENISFSFENGTFLCKSSDELCSEIN